MGAKDLIVKPIDRKTADALVERVHYSGKTVNNSQLHLGVFYNGSLEGAMQFGPSLDKKKIQGLVENTPWNGFIELNRMAFSEALPKNSESRAISVAMRMLKKHAPHVEWVISFADATQCGDGTIYRASGFWLTGIKKNTSLRISLDGDIFTDVGFRTSDKRRNKMKALCNRVGIKESENLDAFSRRLDGFQIRYIYPLAPTVRERLTVPILPYSALDDAGARMYRGARVGGASRSTPADHAGDGGAIPTPTLEP